MKFKEMLKTSELTDRHFWRGVSAEFLGLLIFVYVGVGSVLTNLGQVEGALPSAGEVQGKKISYGAVGNISLCFGLLIFVLIHCIGHISGGHLNPAVTFGLVLAGQASLARGACYIIAQFAGGIVGAAMLLGTLDLQELPGGYNLSSGPESNLYTRGYVTEVILTFLLVFTVFATIDPNRDITSMGPLAIGMAVLVCHLIAVPITGCGINPARSLGPAIFADDAAARRQLSMFLTAPFVGAGIAAIVYPFWFAKVNFRGGLKATFEKHLPDEDAQPLADAEHPSSSAEDSEEPVRLSLRRVFPTKLRSPSICVAVPMF